MPSSPSHWKRGSRSSFSRNPQGFLEAVPLLVALCVFYAFMASAGTFRDLNRQHYYDSMSSGFRAGHLYLALEPSPSLLAAADPFHPSHQREWLWDASLYGGHYYYYWGPIPALLLCLFRGLTGYAKTISDQWLTLAFMVGRLLAGAALILQLAERARIRAPSWLVQTSIAVFGLISPIPFILARPFVYEASLAAGQCFLFCGLWAALSGLFAARRRNLWFLAAGMFWALGIGSRVTVLLAMPPLIALTLAVLWWRIDRERAAWLGAAAALVAPVALAGAAYAAYNFARFGSITEFGVTYQVTTQKFETDSLFVIPNLYSYLFAPVSWSCAFPFVTARRHRPLSPWIDWPRGYQTFELVAGVLVTSAWCWLVLLFAWRGYLHFRRARFRPAPTVDPAELWLIGSALAILPCALPALGLWEASMRYAGDVIGALSLLATSAAFWWMRFVAARFSRGFAWGARAVLGGCALHACLIGALSGMASYNEPFREHNPLLLAWLRQTFSWCEAGP